jgi:hypothetical protein
MCFDPSKDSNTLLCILAFLAPVDEEYPETVKERNANMKVLESLKVPNTRVVFMDGSSAIGQDLIDAVGAASDYPSVAAIQGKNRVASVLTGAFEASQITTFVENLRSGQARLWSLRRNFEDKMAEKIEAESGAKASSKEDVKKKNATTKEETCSGETDKGTCTKKPSMPDAGNKVHDEL